MVTLAGLKDALVVLAETVVSKTNSKSQPKIIRHHAAAPDEGLHPDRSKTHSQFFTGGRRLRV